MTAETAGAAARRAGQRNDERRRAGAGHAELRRPERRFGGYALDLDGTVYLGDALLPGAAATVRRIRRSGSRLVFLTNNPLRSAASYAERLSGLRSEEHTSELQSRPHLVCRLLL